MSHFLKGVPSETIASVRRPQATVFVPLRLSPRPIPNVVPEDVLDVQRRGIGFRIGNAVPEEIRLFGGRDVVFPGHIGPADLGDPESFFSGFGRCR